jgi:hypothetical protein
MGNEQSKNPERIEPRQLSKFQFGSIIKPKSDIFNPPFEFPEREKDGGEIQEMQENQHAKRYRLMNLLKKGEIDQFTYNRLLLQMNKQGDSRHNRVDRFDPPKDMIGVVVSHIKRYPEIVSNVNEAFLSYAPEVIVAFLDMKKTYAEIEANTNPKFFIMKEEDLEKVSVSENFRKNFFKNPGIQNQYEVKDSTLVSYTQLRPFSFNNVCRLQIPNNYNMDNLKGPPVLTATQQKLWDAGPPVDWANNPQLRTNDAWVYLKRFIEMKRGGETKDFTDVFAALNTEVENPGDNAATHIQSLYRGYNRRKKNSAASKIQSHWKKKKKMNKFLLSAKEKKSRKIDNLTYETNDYFKEFEKKVTDSIDNIYRGNEKILFLFSSFFAKIHKFYNYEKYLDEHYILPTKIYNAISMVLNKKGIETCRQNNLKLIRNFFITEKNTYRIHKKLDNYLRIQKTQIKDPDSFKVGDLVLVTNVNFSEKAYVWSLDNESDYRKFRLYYVPHHSQEPSHDEEIHKRLHKIEDETPNNETKIENITKMSTEEAEREQKAMGVFQYNLYAQPAYRHILAKWKKQTRTQANGETKENDRRVSEEEFDLRAEIKKKRLFIIDDIVNDSIFKNKIMYAPEGFIANHTLIQKINNNDENEEFLTTSRNWDEKERKEINNVGDIKVFLENFFSLHMSSRDYRGETKSKVAEPEKLHILSFRKIITRIESGKFENKKTREEFEKRINLVLPGKLSDLGKKKTFFRCMIFYITKLIMNNEFYMSDWSKRPAIKMLGTSPTVPACDEEFIADGDDDYSNQNFIKEKIFWWREYNLQYSNSFLSHTEGKQQFIENQGHLKWLTDYWQKNQKKEWDCNFPSSSNTDDIDSQRQYAKSVTSDIQKSRDDIRWLFEKFKIDLSKWGVGQDCNISLGYRELLKSIIGKTWCALNESNPLLLDNYGHKYCRQAFEQLWQLEENTVMKESSRGMFLSEKDPYCPFWRTSIDYISDAAIYNKSNHYLMSLIERVECIRIFLEEQLFTYLELEDDADLTNLILLSKKMIIYNYNKNHITENNKKNKMFMEFNDFVLRDEQKGSDEADLAKDTAKLSEALAFKIDDTDNYNSFEEGWERRQRYQEIFKKAGIVKRKKFAYDYIKELVEEQSFQNPQWNVPIEWDTFDEATEHFDPRFTHYNWLNFFVGDVYAFNENPPFIRTALNNNSPENYRPYIAGSYNGNTRAGSYNGNTRAGSSNSPNHAGGKRKSKIIKKSRKKKKKTKSRKKKKKTRKKKVKKSE